MSKSTNSRAAFGYSGNSNLATVTTICQKGQFYGISETGKLKVFHITDFVSGYQHDRIVGMISGSSNVTNNLYIKMTPEGAGYSTSISNIEGYDSVPNVQVGWTSGCISRCSCNEYGLLPTTFDGSKTTYYCNTRYWITGRYLVIGGDGGDASSHGIFSINLGMSDKSRSDTLCGLSCEMLAMEENEE